MCLRETERAGISVFQATGNVIRRCVPIGDGGNPWPLGKAKIREM